MLFTLIKPCNIVLYSRSKIDIGLTLITYVKIVHDWQYTEIYSNEDNRT